MLRAMVAALLLAALYAGAPRPARASLTLDDAIRWRSRRNESLLIERESLVSAIAA